MGKKRTRKRVASSGGTNEYWSIGCWTGMPVDEPRVDGTIVEPLQELETVHKIHEYWHG